MTTLALECSTPLGSIAARRDGAEIFSESFRAERGHGPALFAALERALNAAGHCERVVVGLGPGSYSGVRIAVAAAIGLEFGLGCSLLGIPSIVAIRTGEYIAVGDARRRQFFRAHIRDGLLLEAPVLLSPDELKQRLAVESLPVFASAPIEGLPGIGIASPSAEILARLGELEHGIIAEGTLEPMYLRAPHITQPRVA